MECFLVTHTHWDREWYRTFQSFRARLVDAIDLVLDLMEADPGFRFLLDGQTIVLEDYLEIRPERREAIARACQAGRLGIGPWYVQPDSLLPAGETHVRNLLEGRRVGRAFGPLSGVAYTPDSFGHPAQFPQLFAGFGLEPFVYWRGNADEIETLPAEYVWEAPDGSAILVHHLWRGYFSAAGLPADAEEAARGLEQVGRALAERTHSGRVLLMNGIDHAVPSAHTAAVADALARRTSWTVHRALLDDFARGLPRAVPRYRGELLGGRIANLLPGVWSTRTPLKLRNRRVETALLGWAEPWCALGRVFGAPDERSALRAAWRSLLQNQAHDSICGCSQDRVHDQTEARYDAAEELARETTSRVLERLAGLGAERRTPWTEEPDLAVFNPSPHRRTDIVRFPLESNSWFELRGGAAQELSIHPLLRTNVTAEGFVVDGQPARLLSDLGTGRMHLIPGHPPRVVEFVARDVPAFGWKRFRLCPSSAHPDREDEETRIAIDGIEVSAAENGSLAVRFGDRWYQGICGLEDLGDRGDTYDFDPVTDGELAISSVSIRRRTHPSGIQELAVERTISVPAELAADRGRRSAERVAMVVETEARLVPDVARVDLRVRVHNQARDHRLRLLFPTGAAASTFHAATTFDVIERSTAPRDAARWVHAAPSTSPHQGFVFAGGLCVAAPGLPEAEVTPDGVIAITLVRAVGWLSRYDLHTRPEPAGPALPTPGAQCLQPIEARLALFGELDARAACDAELGLRAVAADAQPPVAAGQPLLEINPRQILLSALKPAEDDDGIIIRLLNPTAQAVDACVRLGFAIADARAVRLDETPADLPLSVAGNEISLAVPPHALRSVLVVKGC